jgi:hypothetical protein
MSVADCPRDNWPEMPDRSRLSEYSAFLLRCELPRENPEATLDALSRAPCGLELSSKPLKVVNEVCALSAFNQRLHLEHVARMPSLKQNFRPNDALVSYDEALEVINN